MRAGVDNDALLVMVGVERDVVVEVATILKFVDDEDDARCSADPCWGDDVRGACYACLSGGGDFSVPC